MQNSYYLLVPFLIWASYYLGQVLDVRTRRYVEVIQSFAAGLSIGYIFLVLLPEVILFEQRVLADFPIPAIAITLVGFVFFHTILKMVFRSKNRNRVHFLTDEVHLFAIALYHFIVSFSLIELMKVSGNEAIVLLVLIAVHTTLSELSYHELHHEEKRLFKAPVLFIASFLGAVFPVLGLVNPIFRAVLFSFTAGAIIYISIREEIPEKNHGSPWFFILGAMVSVGAILLLQ